MEPRFGNNDSTSTCLVPRPIPAFQCCTLKSGRDKANIYHSSYFSRPDTVDMEIFALQTFCMTNFRVENFL